MPHGKSKTPNSDPATFGGATIGVKSSPSSAASVPTMAPSSGLAGLMPLLQVGTLLGGRYEILEQLGEGGMGVVYKARDKEVDRVVALKVIRADLAENPEILQRFKQELVLARQITHRNVVRIYDLGDADGLKFITMEYIDGEDLRTILKRDGKLPPEDAAAVVEQICSGLGVAHAEGVIHRDLKPGNIMRDAQGRIVVMDFGLARTLDGDGMTQTGAMLGTIEYMSPEQARAEELHPRSDIFTVGLIFYELLTGKMPYQADTGLASLLKRSQERAIPVAEVKPGIPRELSNIVDKCLERDKENRYQSTQEIVDDLAVWQGKRPREFRLPGLPRWVREMRPRWIALAAGLLIATAVGTAVWKTAVGPNAPPASATPAGTQISLAILPFRNASGDASLDWLGSSLADMLSTDVGQSAQLRTVSPNRLHQIFSDLKISPAMVPDPPTIRRLADFSNADRVVWGQYAKFGDQIRIDATLHDLKNDRTVPIKVEAANEKEVLVSVDRLAQSIRESLAVSPHLMKELQAKSFKPTTKSLDAIRFYNEGVELAREGNNLEALKRLQSSVKQDPEFALAYAKLGQTFASLGYDNEAEQASRRAMELSANLPARERYFVSANHARITKNNPKAIEYYENLVKVSPDDLDIQIALAGLYEITGSLDKARESYSKVVERDPKYVDALLATGRVNIKGGKYQDGLEYLNRALNLAVQLDNQEERATILHAIGNGYAGLNKPEDALRNYQESLEIKRRIGQKRGIAVTLNEIARVQLRLGNAAAALASYQEALRVRREIGDKEGIGASLIDLGIFYNNRGERQQALKLYKEALQIEREIGSETSQSNCLNNIGNIYFARAEYDDALTYFQQALQLREKGKSPQETAVTLHNLAETATAMGRYDEAQTQYLRALEFRRKASDTRGAAIETYSMGTLFERQGRYAAAIKSKQEALQVFRDLHDRTFWMGEILGGYGSVLAQVGQLDEAQKILDEAMSAARELHNQGLIAQTLNFQGDSFFYRGDFRSARTFYERALQAASQTAERDKVLAAKINLAKVEVKEGRTGNALAALGALAPEVDRLGLKYLSAECSIYQGEALVHAKDPRAQAQLERALAATEKFGFQLLQARVHYLTATALRGRHAQAQAAAEYQKTLRLLEDIRKEADHDLLQRPDLALIYKESTRWSPGTANHTTKAGSMVQNF